ncbi:hypothetical protein [Salinibacter altiplanensis]|uniref:hypothetical protein n=1 Tax=Salinibacter altiplanensis TaxID=1803181 RepID=UPI001E34A2E9|nr:hypothetical protein [Salinibacter altiplanensis]
MSLAKAWVVPILLIVVGCGSAEDSPMETDAYNGTITEIDAEEREVHVEVPDEGTMELAFTDTTQVLKNFLEMPFDSLNADRKVRVEVTEAGEQPIPTSVTLLE